MSRSAHAKSTYKLRRLPRCPKCKNEMNLVMASYSNRPKCVYEWECAKCHKIVPKNLLKEELEESEIILTKICKRLQEYEETNKRTDKTKNYKRLLSDPN